MSERRKAVPASGAEALVQELRQVVGRMEVSLGLLPESVVWTDREGRIQWCNVPFDRLTNRPHIEVLGANFARMLPLSPENEHPTARIVRGEQSGQARIRFQSKFLEIQWESTRLNEEDAYIYLIRDRTETERSQAELEALKKGEERFRLAVEAAPNAMIMVDRDGKIVLVNTQTDKMFGYDRAELIGQEIEILVPQRYRGTHPGHRRGFYADRQPRAMGAGRDLFGLRKDGTEIPVEIGLNPIDASEGLALASIIDITERRKIEEQAKDTARLEASKKELEAFCYSVAHDLRAPVRHIDGFIQLLKVGASGRLDERGQDLMDKISHAAKRLGGLIDELLAFSKTARTDLRKAPVSLKALAAEAIAEFKDEAADRDVRWKIAELPEAVCDAAMIKLVFANLIGNALKFSRGRSPAVVELGLGEGGSGELVVFVRDNGAGFDMRYSDKLFGVFQRLHRAEDFEGTGIGLANVRRIIDKHGGRTWAEGAVDKGATFYFTLPAPRTEGPQ